MINKKTISMQRILTAILCLCILSEIIFLYRDIFIWIDMAWFEYPPDRFGPYVSVFFICIFMYQLFKKPKLEAGNNSKGFTVILVGIIVYLIGYVADIHLIQAISLIITCFGIVVFMMGSEWGRTMIFPFAFLILMLPTTSFLLETTFGLIIRNLISVVSGTILNLIGGDWKISNGVLYLHEINLPIRYYRDSISSPLAILILSFIAAELKFSKNRYKFIFVLFFWLPLVLIGHSVFFITMGWAFEQNHNKLSEAIWTSREWFPATFLVILLFLIEIATKLLGRVHSRDNI